MKINATEKAALNDPVTAPIDKRLKPVRNINNGLVKYADEWAKELNVTREAIYMACNKKVKTCKGMRFRYDEDVAEVRDNMATELSNKDNEIAQLKAIIAFMQADAEVGRKIREAEEEKRKAIDNAEREMEEANKECERIQRMVERAEAECQRLVALLMKAEEERDKATTNFLTMKGDVKA